MSKLTWDMVAKWSVGRWDGTVDYNVELNDDEYEELCLNSAASDFYFEVKPSEEPDMVDVCVTPKLYFDLVRRQWDGHLSIDHLLPPETFDCLMEGVWCVEGALHTVNADMLQRGFIKNEAYSQLVLGEDEPTPDTESAVAPAHEHSSSCGSGCSHDHSRSEEPKVLTDAERIMKKITDLKFTDEQTEEERSALIFDFIKSEFNLQREDLITGLATYVQSNAEKLSMNMMNIAPHGNYSKMLHNDDDMAQFLKTEAHEDKNWKLSMISPEHKLNLLRFEFSNKAVDDGESLKGMVYVSYQGKVKHAFAQIEG